MKKFNYLLILYIVVILVTNSVLCPISLADDEEEDSNFTENEISEEYKNTIETINEISKDNKNTAKTINEISKDNKNTAETINEISKNNKNTIETSTENAETGKQIQEPKQLNSRRYAIYDRASGTCMYGKNENKQTAMASTTKIMRAIDVLENSKN